MLSSKNLCFAFKFLIIYMEFWFVFWVNYIFLCVLFGILNSVSFWVLIPAIAYFVDYFGAHLSLSFFHIYIFFNFPERGFVQNYLSHDFFVSNKITFRLECFGFLWQ